jgi:hypothetical protein
MEKAGIPLSDDSAISEMGDDRDSNTLESQVDKLVRSLDLVGQV